MAPDSRTATEKSVLEALEKSGYPLELRVAECLVKANAGVDQGWHFIDPETNVLRETDVVGTFAARSEAAAVNVILVAECKSGNQNWVAFRSRESMVSDPSHLLDLLITKELGQSERLPAVAKHSQLPVQSTFLEPQSIGYSLANARGKDDDNQDRAYRAVMAAMSAAQGVCNEFGEVGFPLTIVVIPVVVAAFPLLDGWLDESGEVQVKETQVTNVSLRVARSDGRKRCVVTTLEGLPRVVTMAQKTAEVLLGGLRHVPDHPVEFADFSVPRESGEMCPEDGLEYDG